MAIGVRKGVPAVNLSAFWRRDSTPCQTILRLSFIDEFWLKLWPTGGRVNNFIVNQNVNDVVLVLVVTFAGVEEPVNREGFKSDSSSRKVY